MVGLSWTLIGIIMGSAPKKGLPPEIIQLFGAVIPIVVGMIVLSTGSLPPIDWSDPDIIRGTLLYAVGSVLNFLFLQLLSYTMQRGPNGIIWAINQAGMFWTFLFGLIFLGDVLNVVRIIGIIMLLTALLLLGLAKDNSSKSGSRMWILLAFSGMLLCGIQQIITTSPTYIPAVRENLNSVARSVIVALFTLVPALIWNICAERKKMLTSLRSAICSKYLWLSVLSMQGFSLLSAYFILYRSMDTLTAHGIGSAAYPLMVSSCLIGFALYSRFGLRERTTVKQTIGLILCILGIISICIK